MDSEEDRGAAQVHWLIAGGFGLGEQGTIKTVTRAELPETMEKAALEVEATISDRVGTGETRKISLKVDSFKALTLKHVVKSIPELVTLLGKADKVAKLKDPSRESLAELIGEGKLLEAMLETIEPAPTPKTADAEATGDVEKIFEKGQVAEKSTKSAIDMFVRNSSSTRKKSRPKARVLRDMVEGAAFGMAADVLRSPEVQALESAWRGLRFMLSQCPKDGGMQVELLETSADNVLEALEERERADGIDEPDCIFIAHEYSESGTMTALAEFAEQEVIPIVISVSPSLFDQEHPQDLPEAFDRLERARNEDVPEWTQTWDQVRMHESTRWLCAVTNRVVLHSEGAGEAKRTVFGAGVWAVAAILSRSFAGHGTFASIYGKIGSVSAPATHTIERGRYSDTAAPTEAFFAINPADGLGKNGLLALSSGRNSDALMLVKTPMVRGAADVIPLPAQILAGRVVRFAYWVRPQLPEGCDSKTANEIYMAAADVFLFPGQEEAAHVRAATTNIDGEAHVVIRASANPSVASIPFEIAFPLPLNWSVPAPEIDAGESPVAAATVEAIERPDPSAIVAEVKADATPEGEGGLAGGSVGFDAGLIDEK